MNNFKINFLNFFIPKEEKKSLLENLNLLLSANISALNALVSIKKSVKSFALKKILDQMIDDIESGSSLSLTLEKSKLFPSYVTSLINVGEKTGTLPDVFSLLIEEQGKSADFKSKLQSAMLYPLIVLSVGLVVIIFVSTFMLPKLATVFSSMHVKMPLITIIVLRIGTFFGKYGYIATPTFIVTFMLLIYFVFIYERTKFIGQAMLLHAPGIKSLLKETEIARFGYLLSSLLNVGISIDFALSVIAEATPICKYKKLYLYLNDSIKEGNSIEDSLNKYSSSLFLLEAPVQTLIISGEHTGKLPSVLKILGEKYNQKADMSSKNLTIILEPIFLVMIWLLVVGVAVAVILPIYSLIGNMSH